MTLQEQIDEFYRFAVDALKSHSFDSVEDVLDQWRSARPSQDEQAEDLAAIKAAVRDMEHGDRGRPVDEVLAHVQAKYNLPDAQ